MSTPRKTSQAPPSSSPLLYGSSSSQDKENSQPALIATSIKPLGSTPLKKATPLKNRPSPMIMEPSSVAEDLSQQGASAAAPGNNALEAMMDEDVRLPPPAPRNTVNNTPIVSQRLDGGSTPLYYPLSDSATPIKPQKQQPGQSITPFLNPTSQLSSVSRLNNSNKSTPRKTRGDIRGDVSSLRKIKISSTRTTTTTASSPLGGGLGLSSSSNNHRHDGVATSSSAALDNMLADGITRGGAAAAAMAEERVIIWGTTVNVEECKLMFKEFLLYFTQADRLEALKDETIVITDQDRQSFYPIVFADMQQQNATILNLDCKNLKAYEHSTKLYKLLIRYPQEIIPVMDFVASQLYDEIFPPLDGGDLVQITVRPYNLGRSVNMRQLDPADIDQMVTIKGLLIRASPVIPDMKTAFFRCNVCGATEESENEHGRIREPTVCPNVGCRSQNSVALIHNRCSFSNKQICKLQETPDETPDGQTPYTVMMFAYDELVDVGKPGDRLEITAIFRGVPVRVNPRKRSVKALYKTYLDVVHIRKHDKKRISVDTSISSAIENQNVAGFTEDGGSSSLTPEEEQKFLNLSRRPDLYDLLSRSLAPSIFGLDDVKKGALMQLFGGTHKVSTGQLGSPRIRGDINVLLIGDPGVSKSQLLQYVHKIAPRGIYTSGKGSSAVGLTAYVTRDPDTRQLVLESGALVLSDGGICCIDEFDKMSDHTRSVLHEVMEQQTISVAKAGIITTLNARTSIIASANPIGSKFDPKRSVVENINLPPPLLSRFDLIFLLLDKPNEEKDRKLAKHIVSLYMTARATSTLEVEFLPLEYFTKYVNYARSTVFPRLSARAADVLVEYYVNMRRVGKLTGQGKTVTGTTRQLESMIRLSEAHAKMRLSPIVEASDVEEAHRLIKEAMQSSAIDPLTGLIDLDLIQTGHSAHSRDVDEAKRNTLRKVINSIDKPTMRWMEVYMHYRESENEKILEKEFDKLLTDLADTDFIHVTGKGMADKMIRKRHSGE